MTDYESLQWLKDEINKYVVPGIGDTGDSVVELVLRLRAERDSLRAERDTLLAESLMSHATTHPENMSLKPQNDDKSGEENEK